MSEIAARLQQVFSPGTILTRVLDAVHWAWIVRDVRGETMFDSVATVAANADTVIAARPGRVLISIQVQGDASGIRVAGGGSTSGGTLGEILDAAPAAGKAGGWWWENRYAGAVALRATTAPVAVHIREIY